ncbi:bifunctional [glutamate--ammonia ligase]-adenylyl-L-tyrosine phosphorylase/[glutamate--ammonia-ligase] adenylyltransferase [Methylomarinum sp. Ch1-1]|uniref:Bifunctional glutamine synthetase adenylyltransferase/adenylyl-removing enzyme n=1 Tax=Methylomarinum roseum TaxID=3067653 RepID=A0AAU7NVI9_9GAMM
MSSFEIESSEIAALPVELRDATASALIGFTRQIQLEAIPSSQRQRFRQSLPKVWACSQFVAGFCQRSPEELLDLLESGRLFSDQARKQYGQVLAEFEPHNEADLAKFLRRFRNKEMTRIAWRDLAGWAELDETLKDLTALAEACIQHALDYLYQQACERRGTPTLQDGKPINIVVLGMGKLGAWELNYSSDIDLIFAYAEDGVLSDRKETTYGEFFTRICRSLVKMLDETTADGFVFRTDIRLRPFGDSGPLIMTFDGMENYYMTQAREWERYAMIKARQVAGDFDSGKQLAAMIKPFVYRRYLDYGAFEELRSLKLQITQELRRKDRMENVKLGPGGIREIEFIGQAFQLIRGGNDVELQQREIQSILRMLESLGLMAREDVATLTNAYVFLRRVENHIQQYQDKQVHDLPKDPMVQKILAFSMDYDDWESFKQVLDKVREAVHAIFDQVFSLSEQEKTLQNSHLIWAGGLGREQSLEYLGEYGYLHCADVYDALQSFKNSHAMKRLTSKGAGVVDRLMPQLIEAVQSTENRDQTLLRILKLLDEVAGRNVYLALLAENPDALAQLVTLSSASPWICEYLAQYPILFDELLDPGSLYEPLKKQALAEQLAQELEKVNVLDDEQLMTLLRQFKHLNVLRVAAADIMGVIPVMVVSDYLTYIAEVILEQVVERAWCMLTAKHGFPPDSDNCAKKFAVLGMGKLGGIELGYASDLDMVFLYDCENGQVMTDGAKPLSCSQFYMRLGQKVRHILDTKMLSGVLYEVDLRLRPSGDSGLLVSHIKTYQSYMEHDAWTWEHQALVRGRFIAGDAALKQQYEAIRSRILALPREMNRLRQEVREMREKMRENLAPKDGDVFDLKQSKGGIADIEFIVQFGVLAHSSENETLAAYTDNIRLLEGLAKHGFVSMENAALLKKAYCAYRDYGHHQVLQGKRAVAGGDEFAEMRKQVEKIWRDLME